MKRPFGIILIFLFVIGCYNANENQAIQEQIIISKWDSTIKAQQDSIDKSRTDSIRLGLPPPSWYSGLNFILDCSDTIYFHDKETGHYISEYEKEPPFVDLQTSDIIELSYVDIKNFIDSIYQTIPSGRFKMIQIVSTSDTINMNSYNALNKHLDIEKRFVKIPFRLITEEEKEKLELIKK